MLSPSFSGDTSVKLDSPSKVPNPGPPAITENPALIPSLKMLYVSDHESTVADPCPPNENRYVSGSMNPVVSVPIIDPADDKTIWLLFGPPVPPKNTGFSVNSFTP
jgi:hypothetical protein